MWISPVGAKGPSTWLFPGCQCGAGTEVEQSGQEPVHLQGDSTASGDLTCCVKCWILAALRHMIVLQKKCNHCLSLGLVHAFTNSILVPLLDFTFLFCKLISIDLSLCFYFFASFLSFALQSLCAQQICSVDECRPFSLREPAVCFSTLHPTEAPV